jgi:hypothetical protein
VGAASKVAAVAALFSTVRRVILEPAEKMESVISRSQFLPFET